MKKYLCISLFFLSLIFSIQLYGNEIEKEKKKEVKKGKPILRIYSNFHTGLNEASSKSIFEIKRAYLGYNYQIDDAFSAQVLLDIGSPEDESTYSLVKRYAYFRNAYIRYKKNRLKIDFGLIGMMQYKTQEKYWGFRYIEKSFNDKYKFGKSVDLGISAEYKITDFFKIDIALVNGEGYSQLEDDGNFEYAAGFHFDFLKYFCYRFFATFERSEDINNMVYCNFLGINYKDKYIGGVEFNYLSNNDFIENQNQLGYSAFASARLFNKWKVFGRYDILGSNILEGYDSPWNLSDDGSTLIFGIEYEIRKQLRVSLNYQDWVSYASNLDDTKYIYFNVEFKL